ncbi:hypothetical protein [Mesotoga prima]|uniref:hypothetical protein n=1 Tax=Mesotoga prima TaxID=1184387 RepID=UPI002FDB3DB9
MPTYSNDTTMQISDSGIVFNPGDEKAVNIYLYNPNLTLVSHSPYIEMIIFSDTYSVNVGVTEEYTWSYPEVDGRSKLEVDISATSGDIKVFINTHDAEYIAVNSGEKLLFNVMAFNTNKIIIEGATGAASGTINIRKLN